MNNKSSFNKDLKNEQKLSKDLLDSFYDDFFSENTKANWERVYDLEKQKQGIDFIIKYKSDSEEIKYFYVDEKAQLDYVNNKNPLPTCAFEILYYKNNHPIRGWLFDETKKTHAYYLINGIKEENGKFIDCRIYSIYRKELIDHLYSLGITEEYLHERYKEMLINNQKKEAVKNMNIYTDGNLQVSNHKEERPLNLVLKLEYLEKHKLAKRIKDFEKTW